MIKDILTFVLGGEADVGKDVITTALEVFNKHSQVSNSYAAGKPRHPLEKSLSCLRGFPHCKIPKSHTLPSRRARYHRQAREASCIHEAHDTLGPDITSYLFSSRRVQWRPFVFPLNWDTHILHMLHGPRERKFRMLTRASHRDIDPSSPCPHSTTIRCLGEGGR